MPRKYNHIYNLIVCDTDDVVGHIAYSLYKSDKVQFIEGFKAKNNGQEPTEDDFCHFHDTYSLKSNVERYRMQATTILNNFLNNTLASTTKQIESDYILNQDNHLKGIISTMKPKHTFRNGVLQSILGAFVFAVIVAAFAFISKYSASDINVSFGDNGVSQEVPADTIVK